MMDIETPEIIIAAHGALPAERNHYFHFSSPLSVFMNWAAIYIPILSLTFGSAKSCLTRLPTSLTKTIIRPPMGNVALHTTIFTCSIFDSILVRKKLFSTMLTNYFNSCFFHNLSISKYTEIVNNKYFDIACKRIEIAYSQPRLFDDLEDDKSDPVEQELGLEEGV